MSTLCTATAYQTSLRLLINGVVHLLVELTSSNIVPTCINACHTYDYRMAIAPNCDKCKKELLEFGAILLSPPDKEGNVRKFHLCTECYEGIMKEIDIQRAA